MYLYYGHRNGTFISEIPNTYHMTYASRMNGRSMIGGTYYNTSSKYKKISWHRDSTTIKTHNDNWMSL